VPGDEFRREGHRLVEWIADYLESPDRYPVLSRVAPGGVRRALPSAAPEHGESYEAIFADFERVIVPALTHWNHPGFFAYFDSSASPPAVLAEFLAAALNQQAMLWRTSPAATELEEVSLSWLRDLLGLPDAFEGVIYDTASVSTLHALAAARQAAAPHIRTAGLQGSPPLRVYASTQAHSSVDKATILLGLGHAALRHVPVDERFSMRADRLRDTIAEDRRAGAVPMAVVATIGTTSTTSVDPVREIAAVCAAERVWLHVDAAYAGPAAMLPERRAHFVGWEQADSIVLNPHKWLFVPVDLSAFYCRRMDVVREAFSLVAEYLRTPDAANNLMDTGIQLGRRFRALKLWMVLRHFGAARLRRVIAEHIRLAQLFARWIDEDPRFERVAPVPFSVVCFRAVPRGATEEALDRFNDELLARVNDTGEVFLSHTKLEGNVVLRLAIGHLQTREQHVRHAWSLLQQHTDQLANSFPA
jgi:aromatic-L-amino-acid decarboxylase